MTARQNVVNQQVDTLKRPALRDNLDRLVRIVGLSKSLTVQRTLGRGGSGTVFEVSPVDSEQRYALKIIKRSKLDHNASQYSAFLREAQIMAALRHPHIVRLLDSCVHPNHFSLLMAPVADMDLAELLRTEASMRSPLYQEYSRKLIPGMGCLANALNYMHSAPRPTWHHDIKAENILFFKGDFKIADFGISKFRSHDESSIVEKVYMTPKYAAPETMSSSKQSCASDIYSFGCVFLEITTWLSCRELLDFAKFRATEIGDTSFYKTLKKTKDWIRLLEEEQELRKCPPDGADSIPFGIIHKMLEEDPKDRPTAHEVCLHFPTFLSSQDRGKGSRPAYNSKHVHANRPLRYE